MYVIRWFLVFDSNHKIRTTGQICILWYYKLYKYMDINQYCAQAIQRHSQNKSAIDTMSNVSVVQKQ